jgi:YD repeat-containing protein
MVYASKTITTHYDDVGRVLSTTDATGQTIWYRYNDLDRQREEFKKECHYCQYKCIGRADYNMEPPWPDTDQCSFRFWPKRHPLATE